MAEGLLSQQREHACVPRNHLPQLVASIGNGAAFHKGREFAAWMGLVPKQYSTGGKAKLSGISKRGNRYLRKILIHRARHGLAL
jgi:transposase